MSRHLPRAAWLLLALATASPAAEEEVVPPGAQCPTGPEYPPSMRESGREGSVTVRVEISPAGAATALSVAQGMGSPFDEAALEAARHCTFTAGKRGGQAVPSVAEMTVGFTAPPLPAHLIGDVVGELSEAKEAVSVTAGAAHTTTDAKGHFELAVDASSGEVWVVLSLPEYRDEALEEHLKPGDARHVRYALHREKIRETVVVGSHLLPPPPAVDPTPQVSHFTVSRADIDRTPGAMEDVARVVQDLPGVAADPDLLATFFVRGGGPDEVVYYLDGVPLTNPFHLGGFATLYNPQLIEAADFFAGGAPARYEPALSGVLDVTYATGETTRPHVDADVSLLTAKVRAETPTPIEGLSVMVAARRSYFELYFAELAHLGLVAQSYVAPDITDLTARVHYRRGAHDLTATFLESSDGLDFIVAPGEHSLIQFGAGLDVSNRLGLGSLRDRIHLGGGSDLDLLAAFTRDHDHVSISSTTFYGTDSLRLDGLFRADLTLAPSERNRFQAGVEYAHRSLDFVGQVSDARDVAPWISLPFVDTGAPNIDVRPAVVHNLLAAYVDDTYHPLRELELAVGGRFQVDATAVQTSYSLRAAASYELPTHTVLKASAGVVTQPNLNPLFLDPGFGNPGLLPERATNAILGFEQPLPFQMLVRVEGYGKWLDHLVVNPDTPTGLQALVAQGVPVFQNGGTGFARGVDLLVLGRTRRFSYGAAYGLVVSERSNPLAAGAVSYPSPWDQRHTAAAHVSFTPAHNWLLSARFSFHTGRPVTPVVGFVRDDTAQKFYPVFGPTNSDRYPPFYEASVRAQRELKAGPLELSLYVEVLNVTNAQNLFATVYSQGDVSTNTWPTASSFNHLPIRPFLGVRGSY